MCFKNISSTENVNLRCMHGRTGQAASLIFADGLDRPCSVSFTYLGVCFTTRMCELSLGGGGFLISYFWGSGIT